MRFDLQGDLPRGVTVLEASAGTGKTYTIAGLAARYVAEGMPLDRLLLVTFTRLATGELRDRVRRRLLEVADGLAGAPSDDPVVALYLERDPATALANLRAALAGFDAATIATTDAFCQEMLSGLGVAGDHEPEAHLLEDVSDLRKEVVDDLYVWRLAGGGAGKPPPYEEAQAIADKATEHAVPLAAAVGGMGAVRVKTADWTRDVLRARKERMAVVTYDDLVLRLKHAVEHNPAAVALLRSRFSAVLVDEFQDTDTHQWAILRAAFTDSSPSAAPSTGTDRALILIGDPKQAIYGFRGGDVYAYLDAAGSAEAQVLDRNHRSDGPLIQAFDTFFERAELGHERIAYLPVEAVHEEPRLRGAGDGAMRVRFALGQDMGSDGWTPAGKARDFVTEDAAADIAALLASSAEIEERPGTWRGVRPSDVAVLVRNRWQANDISAALAAYDVPAVIAGAGSVYETAAARQWLQLLEALERPGNTLRAHAAALTCFWGWDAAAAAVDDERWEEVHDTLHDWAQVLRTRGVASLVEAVTRERDLPARMLAELGGERDLTDVRHLGQLLHGAALTEGLGPSALTQWLRRRIEDAARETGEEESRRLESDARAVQILTVHRAKGLEFGIVYVPYLWDLAAPRWRPEPVVFHDDEDQRTLDVSLEGPAYQEHRARALAEGRGEDLRLLYVALTRARHQVVLWWAATKMGRDSALSRLLFSRDGTRVPDQVAEPTHDRAATPVLRDLAARSEGTIVLERAQRNVAVPPWPGEPEAAGELAVARFDRSLDTAWRRTSYSALTAAAHEAPVVASEPEVAATDDEPDGGASGGGPWAGVPVGTRVGTVVHRALELVDFAAPEFGADVAELGAEAGLRAALATPLGEPFGVALAQVGRKDRIDELEFELPLGGGTLAALAEVLRRHGDPYAERLATLEEAELRGFLTGFLDLTVRLPDGGFAIFDYKTNGLVSYGPDALREEMHRRHYGLQALLYAVALHRYLRWRAPGTEIAGVGYLFLRGMDGAPGAGVFAWTPPPALVEELSDAL